MSHFYALMPDNTVKYISLSGDIVDEIQTIFRNAYEKLKPYGIEESLFDGDLVCRNGENITYVDFILPADFNRIPNNQADISEFVITEDVPKSIFLYDNGKYFFQVFNRKNLLKRKTILRKERGNTFSKMDEDAFIIEDKIQAIYENGKFYFQSYTSANQIFSLLDYVTEATNQEIDSFGNIEGMSLDVNTVKTIANIKTRRLIKLISQSESLGKFMSMKSERKRTLLRKYNINAIINENNDLVLPTNNIGELNRALEFFNEDIFTGPITRSLFRSNSKKRDTL